MKKTAITGVILFLVGIAVSLFGGVMLAKDSGIDNTVKEAYEKYIQGETVHVDQSDSVPADGVTCISFEDVECEVTLLEAETDKIEAVLNGECRVFGDSSAPELEISKNAGNVLICADPDIAYDSIFDNYVEMNELKLTVTIPKSFSGELKFEDFAGTVKCELKEVNVTALSLHDCYCAFNLEINGGENTRLDISDAWGDVDIAGSFSSVECSAIAGKVNVNVLNSDISSVNVEDVAGELTFSLPADIKGKISVSNCLGDFDNELNCSNGSGKVMDKYTCDINGGGSFNFTASDIMGRITIKKKIKDI